MPDIPFAGQVSHSNADQIAVSFHRRRKGMPIWGLLLIVGLGLALLGGFQYRGGNEEGAIQWLVLAAICLSVGGAILFSGRRTVADKTRGLRYRGRITDEGIRLEDGTVISLFPWTHFVEVERHDRMVIGWLRTGLALPIAAEWFADEAQFQEAAAQIARHVAAPRIP